MQRSAGERKAKMQLDNAGSASGAATGKGEEGARYKMLRKLGEGTYGVVYKALDTVSGRYVAIKKIRLGTEEEGMPATALREISILKEINVHHPNVVNLLEVISLSQKLELVFEFCSGDLKQLWNETKQAFSGLKLKSMAYQLCAGAAFCHGLRIIHRDLKPQNLLLSGETLKIADFGLARTFQVPLPQYTHEVVTLWYRAPEVLLGEKKYSLAVDSWSIGTIIPEMASRSALLPGDCEVDELYQIFRMLGTPSEDTWPGVTDLPDYKPIFPQWRAKPLEQSIKNVDSVGLSLIQALLTYDPTRRMSAEAATRHAWFDDVRHMHPSAHPQMP